ncbi:amidohydrolase family protein [Sulfobacillus harzensis]|uniref:Amidohydrolase n=1 Tax=Sulfobacillus harzensis TaxID=2729629 RepID=A0A7Y0L479_9FIRM|nr:amidohydrolase family protein [Sulfobacillus harzensis]NMP22930.1 amidohydrolase [Sulfobacillus harzensis]
MDPKPIYDGHIHIFPGYWQQRIYAWFKRAGWSVRNPDRMEEEIWQDAKTSGVSAASILIYAHRPNIARELNRWLYEWSQGRPELHLYGTVHPDDPDLESIAREALDRFQFAGFKIHCNVQKVRPDDPRLDPLYRLVQERKRSLVVHVGTEPHQNSFVGVDFFRRLMEKYPELRVQVAHLGAAEIDDFVALLPRYPHLYLDTAAIPGTRLWVPQEKLEDIIACHPDRIIYGSDLPIVEEALEVHRARVMSACKTEAVVAQVFHQNVMRLWQGD